MRSISKRTKPSHFVARTVPSESRSSLGMQLADITASNGTGINVNERSALTLSAAFACINVISTDLASLPLKCYQRTKGDGKKEVPDAPGAYLLRWSPDEDETTAFKFRQDWIAHTLGWGNGYAKITRQGGEPSRLDLLDPSKWKGARRADRRLYYHNADTHETLQFGDVMQLAGMGFDGVSGYSPVRLHRQGIALGLAAESFGASFFGNGSTVGGWLKHPRKLTQEARANLRQSVEAVHQGARNAHRLGILEEGMDFVKTSVDPDDAQFLATRQFQVVEVCRLYRVPPHKVGDLSQAHLANVESSNLDYIISTLRPWAVALEMIATLRLLSPEQRATGLYFEHDLTALLRGDMKARAEYYGKMRDLGAINPDEIRDAEGLNPWEDDIGKIVLVPANYVTLKGLADGDEEPPVPIDAGPPADDQQQDEPDEPDDEPDEDPDDEESDPENSDEGDDGNEDRAEVLGWWRRVARWIKRQGADDPGTRVGLR